MSAGQQIRLVSRIGCATVQKDPHSSRGQSGIFAGALVSSAASRMQRLTEWKVCLVNGWDQWWAGQVQSCQTFKFIAAKAEALSWIFPAFFSVTQAVQQMQMKNSCLMCLLTKRTYDESDPKSGPPPLQFLCL
mmetsp:Transcript_71124/g.123352  ORF Transcript_71124/g.123352 Transcript_71124/m.123352 type:complete len:133 (-) Transcript_71124:9-407(-)